MLFSNLFSTKMFSLKQVFQYTLSFALGILVINMTAKIISLYVDFGFSTYWPFGIFHPRIPTVSNLLIAVVTVVVFIVILKNYSRILSRRSFFYGAIVLLILLSNSVQGFEEGIKKPVSGGENKQIQYYHDALEIESFSFFLRHYSELQPDLRQHSKIHPPGAPLFYYFAHRIGFNDWTISILILLISAAISSNH